MVLKELSVMILAKLIEEMTSHSTAAKSVGDKVYINRTLPTVAISYGGAEYLFQGEEASLLLEEAEQFKEVSIEDYILWIARSW